jgi:hypothetical protein
VNDTHALARNRCRIVLRMSETADRSAILITDEPGNGLWELGAFPIGDGLGMMVGWTVESPECGIPPRVARVLARAMVRYGRVTFPSSIGPLGHGDAWLSWGEDAVACPAIASQGAWRWRRPLNLLTTIPLLSTCREDVVFNLFDDPDFPWWHSGQFALLSRPPDTPPPLVSPLPFELFSDDWPKAIGPLSAAGVEIVMRSGVDGDACGVAFQSHTIRRAFVGMLETAASGDGFVVRSVSYAAFG